ncbi:hypothetical protein PBY51_009020 [Eleginops maclovinus]|uniref:Transcription factor E2F7 n=1 Tax=Eleginops maclovinus TaxID=56733 RepID=A0AAN7ZXE6_ELEMC|nr:hypothetical protein PBY51_009020 [Eleginops maclovinus]
MEVECLALKDLTSPRKSSPVVEDDGCHSEQKENICTDRRRSTPLKSAEPPIPTSLKSRKGVAPPDHITPIKQASLSEPWTPTANLKMLISAASPDIRDREMKKVLFRPIENERETPVEEEAELEDSQFEAVEEEEDADKKPSRKQKSLGLLCQKFLALYPDYPPLHSPIWISLDEVATSLGVERRRIYDIVNVLESLTIVGRIAKNSYTWYGRLRLEETLEELQQRGRQQGYHLHGREDDGAEGDAGTAGGNRKDKSLRIMSQKFVMLFLVSKTQTVTLDAAAKILIEDSQDSSSHSKYKTKVRRLYDIANVLTSLGLIKKVHVREERGRKPAFKWLGQVEFKSTGNPVNPPMVPEASQPAAGQDLRRTKMARHASFNVTPTSVAVQRRVNSAPSSPRQHLPGLAFQPVDYSRKTNSNPAVCRLQFGNSTEIRPACISSRPSSPPSPHPEQLLPSSPPPPQCLAYLPSLSQPSLVMLYRPESEESRKRRRREEEEEEGEVMKKKGRLEEEMRASPRSEAAESTRIETPDRPAGQEPAQPSHYLYVPNNAGLNSLNFLLSANKSLPPSGVHALALPYVLVPSSALSHYPLLAGGSEDPSKVNFSLPAVMSPAHFMVGGGAPYGLAEVGWSPLTSPSTPEQTRPWGGAPHSPSGQRHTLNISTAEPLTPHTPKETPTSASKAFFQTPGTLGNVVSAAPVARKRGSAQRRLDVGHPPAS